MIKTLEIVNGPDVGRRFLVDVIQEPMCFWIGKNKNMYDHVIPNSLKYNFIKRSDIQPRLCYYMLATKNN